MSVSAPAGAVNVGGTDKEAVDLSLGAGVDMGSAASGGGQRGQWVVTIAGP